MEEESAVEALNLDVRHELVMTAAAFDGHAVTTHRFSSSRTPEALADSVRERWHAGGVRFVEARRGQWLMLSSRGPAAIETLQLRRTDAGTEGLHSLWQREPNAGEAPASGTPAAASARATHARLRSWLPASARVIRQIAHRDTERGAATVVALSDGSVPWLAEGLRLRLVAAGFAPDASVGAPALGVADGDDGGPQASPATARGASRSSGRALAMRRGAEEVVATIAAHRGETAIVLHWSQAQ